MTGPVEVGDLITWESLDLDGNDIPLCKRFGVVVVLGQNGTIAPPDALWCIWTLTPEEAVEKYKFYKERNIVPTRLYSRKSRCADNSIEEKCLGV